MMSYYPRNQQQEDYAEEEYDEEEGWSNNEFDDTDDEQIDDNRSPGNQYNEQTYPKTQQEDIYDNPDADEILNSAPVNSYPPKTQQKYSYQQPQQENPLTASKKKNMFQTHWTKELQNGGSSNSISSKFAPKVDRVGVAPPIMPKKPPFVRPPDGNNNQNYNRNNNMISNSRVEQQSVEEEFYEVTENHPPTNQNGRHEELIEEDDYVIADHPSNNGPMSGTEFKDKLHQLTLKKGAPKPPPIGSRKNKPMPSPPHVEMTGPIEDENYEVCEQQTPNHFPPRPMLQKNLTNKTSNSPFTSPRTSYKNQQQQPVEEENYEIVTHSQPPTNQQSSKRPPAPIPTENLRNEMPKNTSRKLPNIPTAKPPQCFPPPGRPQVSSKPKPLVPPIQPSEDSDEEDYLIPNSDQQIPTAPDRLSSPRLSMELPPPRNTVSTADVMPNFDRLKKPRPSDSTCLSRDDRTRLENRIKSDGWLNGLAFQQDISQLHMRSILSDQKPGNRPVPTPQTSKPLTIRPPIQLPNQLPIRQPVPLPTQTSVQPPINRPSMPAQKPVAPRFQPPNQKPPKPSQVLPKGLLTQYSWYKGDILRKECEAILSSDMGEGRFIVRNASKGGGYSISIFHDGKTRHLQLKQNNGLYHLGSSVEGFCSIPELISHHQTNYVKMDTGKEVLLRR